VANALTVPHAVAALVLCVAGLAKLRAPRAAARAVGLAPAQVRAFAALEVALGAWALVAAGAASSVSIGALYAGFAVLALVLARRGHACGCFGQMREPASAIHSLLSVALALIATVSAVAAPHTLGWILERPAQTATVLVLGTAGAVYGVVLAYSELPQLWRSWSPDGERRPA